MGLKIIVGVILAITLGTASTLLQLQSAYAYSVRETFAPTTITGENVYVAWWTNKTGNDEVLFRASTDGGASFADKLNLSNTTGSDSNRVEIDSDADSVVVTWWESNQTDDTPVMRVSTDNGATFGPVLMLATNGTIGQEGGEEGE